HPRLLPGVRMSDDGRSDRPAPDAPPRPGAAGPSRIHSTALANFGSRADSRPSDLTRIRMTRIGARIVAAPRVPWWGRLESRVITALVCLGILCVGASAYLVALTVEYFEGIVGA